VLLQANQSYLSGIFVSAGDTVTITNLTGAANDGGSIPWYCPTGFLFQLGVCETSSPAPTPGTDPLPGSPHMILIGYDGTSYYDARSGFTVGAGISNAPLTFLLNDSGLSNNSGSAQFHVKVCKNGMPDGVYYTAFNGTITYPVWHYAPYGVAIHVDSIDAPGYTSRIWLVFVTGGFDAHGQPVTSGAACYNLVSSTVSGSSPHIGLAGYLPCTSCVPGTFQTPSEPPSSGELGQAYWAYDAHFTLDFVVATC
jgi:hypothetical protein